MTNMGTSMFYYLLGALVILLFLLRHLLNNNVNRSNNVSEGLYKLQFKYFIVLIPATFADWLQGPYLYTLYSLYGFKNEEIFLLYFAGFAASVTFGTFISCLADCIGRKKMCIIFSPIYMISCLTKLSKRLDVLLFGRILGGIGTSILFSVFEAWYIHQHVERQQFPISWLSLTLCKATYYNGLLAILAGLVSYFFAEFLQMGPVAPFLLAVPFLIVSASFAINFWDETDMADHDNCFITPKIARQIINIPMIVLCLIQSVFESVMYIFIILWTPVLSPISPPLGIVFSCFMLCIMIGSTIFAWFTSRKYQVKFILILAVLLSSIALAICAAADKYFAYACPYVCFIAFLIYEIAIGLYYPSIGFIRSCIIPERFRAGITSWLRVPMNIITCSSLFYIRNFQVSPEGSNGFSTNSDNNSVYIFTICALALFCTAGLGFKLPTRVSQLMYSANNGNQY